MKGTQLYLTGLQDTYSQKNKQREIRLRLDTLILSSVVMILLLALAFSLGVERGKNTVLILSDKHNSKATASEITSQTKEVIVIPEQNLPQTAESQPQNKPESEPAKPAVESAKVESAKKEYRIQVASYKQSDAAKREIQRLIEKGYKAYQNRSGDYIVVYVGDYSSITAAKDALQLLRAQYKDCLLKKL